MNRRIKLSILTRSIFSTARTLRESDKNLKIEKLLDNATTMEEEIPANSEDVWATSPYPKGSTNRNQGLHSFRPHLDPRETSILLFPGQGVQYVGMGQELFKFPTVVDLFKEASSILGYDLKKLCLNGPKEKLDQTQYAQAAILVCSLASIERLKEERPSGIEKCIATAGFSLGEITALVFAELVKVRGEAMQYASDLVKGAMTTVFYAPDTKIGEVCREAREYAASQGVENPYCGVSNYLFPQCKIIGGHEEAITYLEENKEKLKLRKLRRLPVSGAFHTPLMQPAIEPFSAALYKMRLSDPSIAVHSNVTGKIYLDAKHVKKLLPKQILAPVKWEQILHILYERPEDMPFPFTYECGPGKSMSTILKMVNAKAWDSCICVPA